MHRCAARCCDNSIDSMENVHNCVQNCSASLNEAQEYVQTELSSVQNRLQRCVLDCSDSIKDKMGPSPSESEVKRYNADFENCAVKCVDRHVELLPTMLARMKEVLGKNYQKNLNVSL
ncbi:hypothetical protein AAG570_011939 [Ranatra chinensis]|uniref:Protein FAM136A n=1 Tax=Ranatra chinensis TaxID=642074 RepID=A0ABD0YHC9_9HEMI